MAQTQVSHVSAQLAVVADKIPADSWKNMIITYEPIWAVGPDALKVRLVPFFFFAFTSSCMLASST